MKLKQTPAKTLELFKKWQADYPNYTKLDVENFVNSTFDAPGSEFENWVPSDHIENPKFLENIKDADYRQWASELNNLWLQLGRKMKDEVERNQELYKRIDEDVR